MSITRRSFLATSALLAGGVVLNHSRLAIAAGDPEWLADVQTPPAKLPDDAPKLAPLLVDAQGQPIKTADAWAVRRKEIEAWWLEFLGPAPASREKVPDFEMLERDRDAGVIRQRISYEVEPGIKTEAYLLMPRTAPRGAKLPGVVVLHSTVPHSILQPAGLGKDLEKAFGLELAKRGMVAICPRNYLWPENLRETAKGEAEAFAARKPQTRGMRKMLHDSQVALDLLAVHPAVDPQRLGCVGHSLGGKETLYLAAFDPRIKATVSSEGGIGTKFSNWHDLWYLGAAIKEPSFAHEHHELLALAAPRPFLQLGGDSADGDRSWPFIEAALPVYRLLSPERKPALGLFNHKKGHAMPPEAMEKTLGWLETYL